MKRLSIFNRFKCTAISLCFTFLSIQVQSFAQGSQTVLEKNGLSFNCAIYTEHYKKTGVDGSEYPMIKTGSFNCFCTQANYSFNGKTYTKESFGGQLSSAFDKVKVNSVRIRGEFPNTILEGPASVDFCFGPFEEKGNSLRSLKKGSPLDGLVLVKSICSLSGLDELNQAIRQLENEAKAEKVAEDKKKRDEEQKVKSSNQENTASVDLSATKKEQAEKNTQDSKMESGAEESSSKFNSSTNSYSTRENNAAQAQNLNQQAQQLAMQGDIEGAQALANQANSLDRSVGNATSTSQFIQQQRAIRDSRLTVEAWSRGIDMSANALINLFKPVDLDLIRTAETPEQALQGYEQVRNQIEERRQIADQNFKTFHQQNLQDIQNSKSATEAKANAIVGFANIAGNMAAQAKANADAKKAFQEKKEKFDQFRSELIAIYQKNKATYIQNAANEPIEELEEYYLEMFKFHQCGINSIEQNFNYESSEWSKTTNYCDKPYKSYGAGKIDYKEVVRRKKKLANSFTDKSEMFMNAAKYFANKRVLEDKNDPEGYLIRAELSDDIIGRLGDILIASELDPNRNDIKTIKKNTLNQFAAEFFSAIDEQNINFIAKCIDNKFHKLVLSSENETPVVYAVKKNKELVLNHFIDRLPELQISNTLSNILYLSVAKDADKCVDILIKRKVIDQLDDQPPAFQLAVEYSHELSAITFLRNNKNPTFVLRHFGETGDIVNESKTLRYIVIAGIQSDNDLLIEIAKSKKPEIEKGKYDNRDTYLSYCVRNNSLKAFNALIKDNPIAQNSVDLNGESLVQVAAKSGSFRLVKRLHQLGADFSTLNNNVDLIFDEKSISMLETYQEVGINVNIQNTEGNTIFHEAVFKNDMTFFNSQLIPDLSIKNKEGYTPIHLAAWKQNIQIVRSILSKKNVDINVRGPYQWSALHFAARENNLDMIQTLLAFGADKNLKDQWGRTPMHVAKERGFTESKALLK